MPGRVHPMVYGAVGSVWGQLCVCCGREGSLPAAPGTGDAAGEGRDEKALESQHHQVLCRIQPAAVFLCHLLHTSLLGGIWQCHTKISYLLVFKKEKYGQVQFGSP